MYRFGDPPVPRDDPIVEGEHDGWELRRCGMDGGSLHDDKAQPALSLLAEVVDVSVRRQVVPCEVGEVGAADDAVLERDGTYLQRAQNVS
jgi:hypothetical protein